MTIPEQAVQAMPERIFLGCADTDNEHQVWTDEDEGGTEYVRADLAAPHLAAVQVKKLEWRKDKYPKSYISDIGPLTYSVFWDDEAEWSDIAAPYDLILGDHDGDTLGSFESVDAAKAAAQADYAARILSALEPYAGRGAVLEEAASMLEAKAEAANSRAVAFTEKLSGPLKGRKQSERWRSEKNHNERIKFYYLKAATAIRALHPQADKPIDDGAQGEGWIMSPPKFHRYPYFVENISGKWCLCKHHGNGASHTISMHETAREARDAASTLPTPAAGEVA